MERLYISLSELQVAATLVVISRQSAKPTANAPSEVKREAIRIGTWYVELDALILIRYSKDLLHKK